jgi:asparagine synthetase A
MRTGEFVQSDCRDFRWNARQILYQWEWDKLVWKEHGMGKAKKHTPEQIVTILRQIEVAVSNGKTAPMASREAGITEQTYYR